MSRTSIRLAVVLCLVLAVAVGGMSLFAKPGGSKGWTKCPWPPCMAPCVLGQEPTVLCKTPGGGVTKTTWACCCCGGGQASYKPL